MQNAHLILLLFQELLANLPASDADLDPIGVSTNDRVLLPLGALVPVLLAGDHDQEPHLLQDELGLLAALHGGVGLDLEFGEDFGGFDEVLFPLLDGGGLVGLCLIVVGEEEGDAGARGFEEDLGLGV